MSILWTIKPNTLPAFISGQRVIARGPLINLSKLQELISDGSVDVENDEHMWLATRKCRSDLQKYSWDHAQVGRMLCALRPGRQPKGDYKKSEWCEVDSGESYPCDVYGLPFDEVRGKRNPNGLSIYLKFSLDEHGELMLVLVSCHL